MEHAWNQNRDDNAFLAEDILSVTLERGRFFSFMSMNTSQAWNGYIRASEEVHQHILLFAVNHVDDEYDDTIV